MGVSKTRLAREIGYAEAQRVNAMATARVLRQAEGASWQTLLCIAPDEAIYDGQPLWPQHLPRLAQGNGNLGDRMARAFYAAPNGNVLFIGTDMPDLRRVHIEGAIKSLRINEAVFGPADDGGFWLFGLRKKTSSRAPFSDVRWSSEYALQDVRHNLGQNPIGYLDTFTDLDDGAALKTWTASRKRQA